MVAYTCSLDTRIYVYVFYATAHGLVRCRTTVRVVGEKAAIVVHVITVVVVPIHVKIDSLHGCPVESIIPFPYTEAAWVTVITMNCPLLLWIRGKFGFDLSNYG